MSTKELDWAANMIATKSLSLDDARIAWQQRDARALEQEQAVMLLAKKHNAAAREDKLNGEIVLRFRYKDGGVMSKRVEVHIDEK